MKISRGQKLGEGVDDPGRDIDLAGADGYVGGSTDDQDHRRDHEKDADMQEARPLQ